MSRVLRFKHPMGYVMMGDAEARHRLQRCGLGLQPPRGKLHSYRSGQESTDKDVGNGAFVPGIRGRAEAAGADGRADALVTYNAAHFRVAAARFGVRLARPAEILREVVT